MAYLYKFVQKKPACVIAFDFSGFGLTDNPGDHSGGYRNKFLMQ